MGKASFIELQDSKGRIQVYVSRDDINTEAQPEMYNTVFKKLLDISVCGVKGFVFAHRWAKSAFIIRDDCFEQIVATIADCEIQRRCSL